LLHSARHFDSYILLHKHIAYCYIFLGPARILMFIYKTCSYKNYVTERKIAPKTLQNST